MPRICHLRGEIAGTAARFDNVKYLKWLFSRYSSAQLLRGPREIKKGFHFRESFYVSTANRPQSEREFRVEGGAFDYRFKSAGKTSSGWLLSLLGPVDPSFRALSGRLKFTVRRHKFNTDSLFWLDRTWQVCSSMGIQPRVG